MTGSHEVRGFESPILHHVRYARHLRCPGFFSPCERGLPWPKRKIGQLFDMHISHIGINASTDEEAERIVSQFQTLMGLQRNVVAPISVFAGTLVEVMRPGRWGEKGHIGLYVNDIPAAERWFEARGFQIDQNARALNPGRSTHLVYFRTRLRGFAIHLTCDE